MNGTSDRLVEDLTSGDALGRFPDRVPDPRATRGDR